VPPASLSPSPSSVYACPGHSMSWDSDTFWSTYPFHLHDPRSKYNPGYDIVSLSPPTIRSARCLGSAQTAGTPCTWCSTLPFDVEAVRDRAGQSFKDVRIEGRFNNEQLQEKIAHLKDQLNVMRLQVLNLSRSLSSAQKKIDEYHALIQFLGTHSVPGLHRIFPNALNEGWGIKALFERIQAAFHRRYTPRNYTQYEIDLAILLYELGGGSAVYAMSHSIFALPSLNTLQPYRRQLRPRPCLTHPDIVTISNNISAVFGSHKEKGGIIRGGPEKKCMHGLMLDELAIERQIGYDPSTDEMVGFCLEHIKPLDTLLVGKDTRTVEAAVAAVKDGQVHIAHEATVAAIGHLTRNDYGAKPVFVGPTCKKGNWRSMLETIQSILEAWNHSPDGAEKHGKIIKI
ncbi:hypothetical protein R3P38DRAFT_2436017, partial [Favolaschia claudopus]